MVTLLALGCAYKVAVTSRPPGATLDLPDGTSVTTPAEVVLRWAPFQHQWVIAYAPGYRTVTFDLRRSEIRLSHYWSDALWRPGTWLGKPRGELEFAMVPIHGQSGTWTRDDVQF